MGIPAADPWSRDQSNHPPSITPGFIGTADSIASARKWLQRAAEGVDGNDEYHPFCGFQPDGPFQSQLRTNGPDARISAHEVRELTRRGMKKLDGFRALLAIIEDRLKQLADLGAPPVAVFVVLPEVITKQYFSVTQMNRGVQTVWNLRAGIKARAMQLANGLITGLHRIVHRARLSRLGPGCRRARRGRYRRR